MATKTTDAPQIRELFVEELAEVQGGSGGPCEPILDLFAIDCATTQACCEEGPDNCCA